MNPQLEFETDSRGLSFCEEIARIMMREFTIPYPEAVGRINRHWRGQSIIGDDIVYHEDGFFWANDIYYGGDSSWWRKLPGLKPLPYP